MLWLFPKPIFFVVVVVYTRELINYSRTSVYSEHLSIVNTTKAIAARAIVTKKDTHCGAAHREEKEGATERDQDEGMTPRNTE